MTPSPIKTGKGFGGQVKEDELRIWPELGWGEEIREGEQMSDILIMKKMHSMIQKRFQIQMLLCFAMA